MLLIAAINEYVMALRNMTSIIHWYYCGERKQSRHIDVGSPLHSLQCTEYATSRSEYRTREGTNRSQLARVIMTSLIVYDVKLKGAKRGRRWERGRYGSTYMAIQTWSPNTSQAIPSYVPLLSGGLSPGRYIFVYLSLWRR